MARILVIDDNAVNREYALQILRGMGHQGESVSDGPRAVEILKSRRYDLILLDIRMPGMDGYEAAKYIRALETPQLRTPIIAVTAYGGVDNFEANRQAGINGFLSKPLTVDKIRSVFSRWVDRSPRRVQRFIRKKKKFKFDLGHDPI